MVVDERRREKNEVVYTRFLHSGTKCEEHLLYPRLNSRIAYADGVTKQLGNDKIQ